METVGPAVASVQIEGTGGLLDLVDGIPVHPLVVHLAVVMVPVAAIGLIVMAASRRFSRKFGWLVALISIVALGSSFVAKEAGEALVARVGEPGFAHAELGDQMVIFAGVLVVATLVLWLVDRTGPADQPSRGLRVAAAAVAVLVAAANLLWIFRVGHSGAKSVWADAVAEGPATAESSPTPSATGTAPTETAPATATATTAAAAASYTMAQVADHDTPADCWVVVDGNVYDLTEWEDLHPGGAQRITNLCGRDATAGFRDQHGSQSRPNDVLDSYQIGTIS